MKKIATSNFGNFFKVLATTKRSQVAEMVPAPGQSTGGSENAHESSDQWLYVVSGHGKAVVEGKEINISTGDLLLVESGEKHEIKNTGREPLKTFNIYSPPVY